MSAVNFRIKTCPLYQIFLISHPFSYPFEKNFLIFLIFPILLAFWGEDKGKKIFRCLKVAKEGASLVIQWVRFCTHNAGGPHPVPRQGPRFHMPHLGVHTRQLKIPSAATKSRSSQINIKTKKVAKHGNTKL